MYLTTPFCTATPPPSSEMSTHCFVRLSKPTDPKPGSRAYCLTPTAMVRQATDLITSSASFGETLALHSVCKHLPLMRAKLSVHGAARSAMVAASFARLSNLIFSYHTHCDLPAGAVMTAVAVITATSRLYITCILRQSVRHSFKTIQFDPVLWDSSYDELVQ